MPQSLRARGGQPGLMEGPPCAGRVQAAPWLLRARNKWLCLLLSSAGAPCWFPLTQCQSFSLRDGWRHPLSPMGARKAPWSTGPGRDTPAAPCPQGRAQRVHAAGSGHTLPRWQHLAGHRKGHFGWGDPSPEQSLPSPSPTAEQKGQRGRFPGWGEGTSPAPVTAPCPAPSKLGCSEHELEQPHRHSHGRTDQSVAKTEPTGLATFGGHRAGNRPHMPCRRQRRFRSHPGHLHLGGPTFSTSPHPPSPELVAVVPREGLGGSYLQGCRVSKGLQGLQGLQGLSSVGLWLLGDKLQGKTRQQGVSGCPPVAQPP